MKKAVLVFCRNYLVDDFKATLAGFVERYDFHYLTDGAAAGVTDTRSRFYARLKTAPAIPGWSQADEAEAINRCRVLRALPRTKAEQMLRAMASVMAEELDRVSPKFVFAQMVDEYVTYVLAELARRRGIVYVGTAGSYFPGHIQVTRYWHGLPQNFREVPADETAEMLKLISERTFRQNYSQPVGYSWSKHLKSVLRYKVKQVAFWLKGNLQGDPLNIHYVCLPFVVERRRMADFPLVTDFHGDWQGKLDGLVKANGKPVIYHPLAYYPESTINYWVGNMEMLDYEAVVIRICRTLAKNFNVVVKEHLHMAGARNRNFYRALNAIEGVVNVPTEAFSNDVVARVDGVVIGGGSIGVEGYVRNMPIATFCDTSYWFQPSGATFLDLSNIDAWPGQVSSLLARTNNLTAKAGSAFVDQCLQSTMRSRTTGKTWPLPMVSDLDALFKSLET